MSRARQRSVALAISGVVLLSLLGTAFAASSSAATCPPGSTWDIETHACISDGPPDTTPPPTTPPPTVPPGPGSGFPWVGSVGDSYISGEAGRWAGNTNGDSLRIDALGYIAYLDNATRDAEQIAGCHRSWSAEALFNQATGMNLACSGAQTMTRTDGSTFKPGLDFADDQQGHRGQAKMLQEFATDHNVKLLPLSIGGNNFKFPDIVMACLAAFLDANLPDCKDSPSVNANLKPTNVATQTTAIKNAILNIHQAMTNAGYADSSYTILVQDYPSPIPSGAGFRYGADRQSTGGCGLRNTDADWTNSTVVPTVDGAVRRAATQTGLANVKFLELSSAFNGRRLCEKTVGPTGDSGLSRTASVRRTTEEHRSVASARSPAPATTASLSRTWSSNRRASCHESSA